MRQAEPALHPAGLKPHAIEQTLSPARQLAEDHEFWPLHHGSLVLFMHPKMFRYYHIPDHSTPYLITVEKGFNLEPLQKVIDDNKSFFVLALSHKNVQLYKGDKYQLTPVHLKNFPTDMKETLRIDEYPSWRETHAIAPTRAGKGSEASHGQYNVSQTDKTMLLEFFRRIDKRLRAFLQSTQEPLILAGAGYLIPMYRQANTSPYLFPETIKGSLGRANLDTIRKRAWSLISRGDRP